MDIVIQGPQGSGKSKTVEAIADTYNEPAILRFWGYKKKYDAQILKHVKACNDENVTPLIVFEELTREAMAGALTCSKFVKSQKGAEQIDTIYVTQERLNIS